MDVKSLSELLKGTIDPTVRYAERLRDFNLNIHLRTEAEKKLAEVHKIIGFGPVLLQVRQIILITIMISILTRL